SHTYALRVSSRVTTEEFERYEPIDEQMDFHEKIRLLYVALKRARDHLVVSVHRTTRVLDPIERQKWTHAELVWEAAREAQNVTALEAAPDAPALGPGLVPSVVPVLGWDEWSAARDAALAASARPRVRSATAIAAGVAAESHDHVVDPGLVKDPRDLELPPW